MKLSSCFEIYIANATSTKLLTSFQYFLIHLIKGQLIWKANCQAMNSSKKWTNEFVFTTMRRAFVRFLEEIETNKKTFRN